MFIYWNEIDLYFRKTEKKQVFQSFNQLSESFWLRETRLRTETMTWLDGAIETIHRSASKRRNTLIASSKSTRISSFSSIRLIRCPLVESKRSSVSSRWGSYPSFSSGRTGPPIYQDLPGNHTTHEPWLLRLMKKQLHYDDFQHWIFHLPGWLDRQ